MVDHVKSRIDEARALLEKGNLVSARFAIKKILRKQPGNIAARIVQADIFLRSGEQAESLAAVNRILRSIETGSLDNELQLKLADICVGNELFIEAEALLDEAESKVPEHPALERLRQRIVDGREDKPNHASAQEALRRGIQAHQSGRYADATGWYQKVLEIQPENTDALNNLGGVFQARGKLDEAIACYKKATSINPDSAEAHYNLGNALKEQGELDKAVASYQKAISIKPEFAEAHNNLGFAQQELGRMEEAVASYQEAISVQPGLAEAYTNIGLLYEKMNDLARAEKYIAKALGIAPGAANINYAQAVILRRKGEIDEAIRLLESFAGKNIPDPVAAKNIHFELGRLYDRKQNSSKAFHHIARGNGLHARSYQSTIAQKSEFLSDINAVKRTLSRDWVRSWSSIPPVQGTTNAFIVGFPRSGTTLLDQILDSHPGIQVMEEKEAIKVVAQSIPGDYPQSLASIEEPDILKLRELYFKTVDGYISRDPNTILVDKFPLNIRHIPLITRLFPDARVILAMRHPCDVVLSNFMQNYKINNAMANFFTIEDSALAYKRVMALWQKSISLLPVNYHTVKYESLVTGFNDEVSQLLEFLGVDWDDAVLEYDSHAKKRGTIKTPSYQSVTEPIYQRAKFRWKRYADQLEPVMDDLQPFIESFGY